LYTWTTASRSSPLPCTHVAIPCSASGPRMGLAQNSPLGALVAAPIRHTLPERESQAQTVKSSKLVSE